MTAEVEPTEQNETTWDFRSMEAKWQPYWEETKVFEPTNEEGKEARYVADMFPYPSGDLHMGHAEAFAIGDVTARFWKQKGYDVLHPIGWDSFGLPAENAAIKNNTHPKEWTYKNIETQAGSFKRYGIMTDWSADCTPLTPNTTSGPSGSSSSSTRRGWPTVGTPRSTGAPRTRPCWPTSRLSTASANAATPP